MNPSEQPDLREDAQTRSRVERLRSSLRVHALSTDTEAMRPRAISVHEATGFEVGSRQRLASQRFLRNTVLAVSMAGAGLWAASNVSDLADVMQKVCIGCTHNVEQQASGPVSVDPSERLRDVEYVMTNDLSSLSEEQVRDSLNYVSTVYQGKDKKTLDVPSRLLLTKWAADNAGLGDVGLSWKDVYGVIHAESSWVPRTGVGKNGVKSEGLGQFEGATAKGYGLKNTNDPLHSIAAAARLVKDGAVWTQKRIENLPMTAVKKAMVLREGVSVYYNTGWTTRKKWEPESSQKLPVETRSHIRNVKAGGMIAETLVEDIKAGVVIDKPTITMEKDATEKASRLLAHLKLPLSKAKEAARKSGLVPG
jgi:hypothetical protein